MPWNSLAFRGARSGAVCGTGKAAAAPWPQGQADRRLSRNSQQGWRTHREHRHSLSLSRGWHCPAPAAGTSTHKAESQSPLQFVVLRPAHTHSLPSAFPCLVPELPQSLLVLVFASSPTPQKESWTIPGCSFPPVSPISL